MRTRRLYILSGALVIAIAATATFGYGLIVNKSLQQSESAPKSKAASVVPTIPSTNYAAPGSAIYMSPSGNDANNGTSGAPVKTMTRAIALAPNGGTIVLRAGTYRDGNARTSKALTWQAYPGEQVWFDGTDVVSGWQASGGTWYIDGWNTPEFCNGEYYNYAQDAQRADNTGPCNHKDMSLDPSNPMAGSPQMAFINGTALKEVTNIGAVTSGTFFYDKTSKRFSVGTNPSGATVELARRPIALLSTAAMTVKGLGFKHYASNEYNNSTEAALFASGANSLIENSVFWANAGYGLGLSQPTNDIVRSSQFLTNGFDGMTGNGHHATGALDNILIEGNIFDNNNTEKFGTGCGLSCAQAGVKFSHMNGGTIKNNKFTNNQGEGFWCDLYCTNFTITGNYASGNTRTSLMYEVSDKAIIASNVVIGGEYGVRIAGPNVKFYNNTVINPGRMALWVYDDPRLPSGSEIPADTTNVEIGNNIIQGGTDFTQWLEGHQTTWSQLESYSDYNSFYRPTGKPAVGFKYGTNGTDSYSNTVVAYHTATGKEANSQDIINNANPYFTNASAGDYRIRSDSVAYKTGKALASDVAAAIGVTAGQSIDRGAVNWVGKTGGTGTPTPTPTPTPLPAPSITSFSANPSTVIVSNATSLSWQTTNTTTCSVSPDGPTDTSLTTWAPLAFTATGSKTYTLSCKNSAGVTTSKTVTVTINPAPSPPSNVSLSASITSITSGNTVNLQWSSVGATGCVLNPGNYSASGASSAKTLSPTATTDYTVTCANNAGSTKSNTVKVTVTPPNQPTPPPADPTITSFTATPANVAYGASTNLAWQTSNVATSGCALASNVGAINTSASASSAWTSPLLTSSISFTLTCKNAANKEVSKSVSVVVADKPAPAAPAPVPATTIPSAPQTEVAGGTALVTATTGQKVIDVTQSSVIPQGQPASLDVSTVTNADKIQTVSRVEFYDGQTLVQTIAAAPFVLDTKVLAAGAHTITQRTYYKDGSMSAQSQLIEVKGIGTVAGAGKTSAASSQSLLRNILIGVGGLIAVLVGFAAAVWFFVLRPRGYSVGYTISRTFGLIKQYMPHKKPEPSFTMTNDPDANVQIISPTDNKEA